MSAPGFSRRTFLGRSAGVFGGAALLGSGALGVGRVLAGSPATKWVQPAVRRSRNGVLDTRLRVAETEVPIAGRRARALTYEAAYPAPTLEVNAGDELGVRLINDAGKPTNLHTHGLHVSPQKPADDVLLNIEEGEDFRYRYELPADHPGGTYWYHAHRHMLSDNQVFGGLFGMLVVRGELDEIDGIAGLEERPFLISQSEIVDGSVADGDASSLSDQSTLVNGQLRPRLTMATGDTQRWRLVNASSVFLRLELEGHQLHIIGIDGNALPETVAQRIVEVPPGGRVDALVQGARAGKFRFRSLSWKNFGAFYSSMVPVAGIIAELEVRGPAEAHPAPLPTTLLPLDDLAEAEIDRTRHFRLEEREPRGVGPIDAFEYYINGRKFDASRVNEQIPLGATEEWEWRNLTYEPHPLHIHVNPFQVVAIDGDRSRAERFYRDTAMVPPFGSLTIRHRFTDFTGLTVMHCHILFHEDHGMMQLLEIYGDEGPGPTELPHTETHAEMAAASSPWFCRLPGASNI